MPSPGSLEDWNGSRCDSDQGFSEDALTLKQDPLMPPKVTAAAGRKTGFAKKAEECSAEDPRLTLQQGLNSIHLRILTKIVMKKFTKIFMKKLSKS